VVGYGGLLHAAGWGSALLVALVGAVSAVPLVWALRQRSARIAVAAAWPPLHALLLLTGGHTSPLVPLAALWIAGVGRMVPRAVPGAAGLGLLLLLGAELWVGVEIQVGSLLLTCLVFAGGAAAARFLRPKVLSDAPPPLLDPAAGPVARRTEAEALVRVLDLARRATDAREVVLWEEARAGETLHLTARVAAEEFSPPPPELTIEGHPFGWALAEQIHVHLERGRRPLPTPWAEEMLIAPLDGGGGVLTFAYSGVVPPGAGASAAVAARVLAETRLLTRARSDLREDRNRLRVLANAVQTLPAELDPRRFSELLTEALVDLTGGEGAAVALWDADARSGTLIASLGDPAGLRLGTSICEGESRLALACKHGASLCLAEIPSGTRGVPVLAAGERWLRNPRSLLIYPISVGESALAAAVVWHSEPHRIGPSEHESVEMLCGVAAPALHTAVLYEKLDRKATTDALTGLPNRGAFEARLASAAAHFQRYGRPFSLIILDVDHFKRFNDSWGHEAGDRVLQHVASILRSSIRQVDFPARLGGEEFVILLPETLAERAIEVAERVRAAIERSAVPWNRHRLSVTASLGIAGCPENSHLPADVLSTADAALYQAKESGRNRVVPASPELRHP
jgi:diguanylate cyclase (GGDEF)-like protein